MAAERIVRRRAELRSFVREKQRRDRKVPPLFFSRCDQGWRLALTEASPLAFAFALALAFTGEM
jgi:hypothetical protein